MLRARAGALPAAELAEAAAAVRSGAILAFPTDTVYGLGGSALVAGVAERLYALKARDPRKPLPILVDSLAEARRWAAFSEPAEALARRFWPGALTLVLAPTDAGRRLLSPGAASLALRVPDHALVRALIAASGAPWASSSANAAGEPALLDGEPVAAAFAGRVELIVDGGKCPGGVASTVIDARGPAARVLREGALDRKALESAGVKVE